MPTYPNLDGTMELDFHIGGPLGPEWSANGQALEALDSTGAALTIVRGLTPAAGLAGIDDLVPKAFLLEGRISGWALFDAAGVIVKSTPLFVANAVVTNEINPVAHMRYTITTSRAIPLLDATLTVSPDDYRIILQKERLTPTTLRVGALDTFNLAHASPFTIIMTERVP